MLKNVLKEPNFYILSINHLNLTKYKIQYVNKLYSLYFLNPFNTHINHILKDFTFFNFYY